PCRHSLRFRLARIAPAGGGVPPGQYGLDQASGENRFSAGGSCPPLSQDQRRLAGSSALRAARHRHTPLMPSGSLEHETGRVGKLSGFRREHAAARLSRRQERRGALARVVLVALLLLVPSFAQAVEAI